MKYDKLPPLTEKAFMANVTSLAKDLGYWVYHNWTSIHSPRGLPDLLMVKGDRLLWAELKNEKGKLSPHQEDVMALLKAAGQEVYLWKPSMMHEIAEILARRDRSPD